MSEKTLRDLQNAVEAHFTEEEGEPVGVSFVVAAELTNAATGNYAPSYAIGEAVSGSHAVGIVHQSLDLIKYDLSERE